MLGPATALFAFHVVPGQAPQGGAVTITNELRGALTDAYSRAKAPQGLWVVFEMNTVTRSNPVLGGVQDHRGTGTEGAGGSTMQGGPTLGQRLTARGHSRIAGEMAASLKAGSLCPAFAQVRDGNSSP